MVKHSIPVRQDSDVLCVSMLSVIQKFPWWNTRAENINAHMNVSSGRMNRVEMFSNLLFVELDSSGDRLG